MQNHVIQAVVDLEIPTSLIEFNHSHKNVLND